jgi:monoamine oxidase
MAQGGARGKSKKQKTSIPRGRSTASNAKPRQVKVAIIGGGIAGLYCGHQLLIQAKEKDFLIAEESTHIGGRIFSTRILRDGTLVPDGKSVKKHAQGYFTYKKIPVEFCAEFGPMRIELALQEKLMTLLKSLSLYKEKEPFPPYQSPPSEHDPKYKLTDEESAQSTPLDLLKLAVVRIMGKLGRSTRITKETDSERDKADRACLDLKLEELINDLSQDIATRQSSWQDSFEHWVETLEERDYQNIRQFGIFVDGKVRTHLWNMGFWNLLSEVLSHHAVLKIRDFGTFYHLIPENPNAAEWVIFWLRALRTSPELVGIRGGIQRITEEMTRKIGRNRIINNYKLVDIAPNGSRVNLTFEGKDGKKVWSAEHVILALPTAALKELVKKTGNIFYKDLNNDLGAVFGFPLLKFFFTVKERWWDEDEARTNRYATMIPTRELHYRKSSLKDSKKGIIMVYTDRPALTFWSNYIKASKDSKTIPSGIQSKPDIFPPDENLPLIKKALQYLKENGVRKDLGDIEFYGIRDWGRRPYVGAAHSWYPQRKPWEILKRLSAFGSNDNVEGLKNIHICGEAYSDYQAFIEGALRSSAHVLHTINRKMFPSTPTPWLCDKKCSYTDPASEMKRLKGDKSQKCRI